MISAEEFVFQLDQPDLLASLNAMSAEALDDLPFGVIHFDGDCMVLRYNRHEQRQAGLAPEKAVGKHVFTELAQCMNNFMVAEKFVEATESAQALDATIDYVLTWRMKPTPVKLRMLKGQDQPGGYILLGRLA